MQRVRRIFALAAGTATSLFFVVQNYFKFY